MTWVYVLCALPFVVGLMANSILDYLWEKADEKSAEAKKSKRTSRTHHDELADNDTSMKSSPALEGDADLDVPEELTHSPRQPIRAAKPRTQKTESPQRRDPEEELASHADLAASPAFDYAEFRGNRSH